MKEAPGLALAPPPGNPRFPYLDGMRAFATITVVAYHVGLHTGALTDHGWQFWLATLTFGPQMFFMFSGFLIYRPFVSHRVLGTKKVKVGAYARRRAVRILPGYWVALTVLAIFPGLVGGVLGSDWWIYYGLLHTYFGDEVTGGLGVSWTLCTEVSFYAVLPLVAWGVTRLARATSLRTARRAEVGALLLMVVLSYAWIRYWRSDGPITPMDYARGLWLPGTAAFFAIGMLFAIATVPLPGERPLRDRIPNWRAFSVGCIAIALLIYWLRMEVRPHPELNLQLNGLLSAFLLAPAILAREGDRGPERVLGTRSAAWLGLVAYGIYLYHGPIIVELHERGIGGPDFVGVATLFAAAIAIATMLGTLSYRLVESPALRFKEGRRRAPAPTPAPEPAVTT